MRDVVARAKYHVARLRSLSLNGLGVHVIFASEQEPATPKVAYRQQSMRIHSVSTPISMICLQIGCVYINWHYHHHHYHYHHTVTTFGVQVHSSVSTLDLPVFRLDLPIHPMVAAHLIQCYLDF